MRVALDVLSATLLLTAVAFVLLAALGLHRFDDVFSRVHAATKSVTFGVLLAAAGAALQVDTGADTAKLILAAVLQLIGSPASAHLVMRGAYRTGAPLSPHTTVDHLAETGRVAENGDGRDDRPPPAIARAVDD